MRLADVMTRRPLLVGPDADAQHVAGLAQTARVRHLPVMDGGRVTGMWVAFADEPARLLSPDTVHLAAPGDDAEDAVVQLLEGAEAVVVMDGGRAVGMLTRADVLAIVRTALSRGVGRPPERPLVVLLVGPADAGKSTLLAATVPMLGDCRVGVVRADAELGTPPSTTTIAGATAITDARAHWRRGLRGAVDALGDVQVVLVEDRDRDPDVRGGPGGDLHVVVVPAVGADDLTAAAVREAQAVVLTKSDQADPEVARRTRDRLRADNPEVAVFTVSTGGDGSGLGEWARWLEGRILPRGHR